MSGSPRKRRLGRSVVLIVALACSAPAAYACPVCHTETGKEVRAGLFNEDFAFNLFASILPFPIFLGIVAAIHGLPSRGGQSRELEYRHEHRITTEAGTGWYRR